MTDDPRLHPLLQERFSPLHFDARHELNEDEVDVLLEAARWAPSAGNSQPWGFVVARRGSDSHRLLVEHLAASSARWAPEASALVVNLVHRSVAGTDWVFSEFADYDLGQAVAHLTIQAQSMGLAVRQFRAFDLDGLRSALQVEDGWEVLTMAAVGLAADRGAPMRERRAPEDLRRAVAARAPSPD